MGGLVFLPSSEGYGVDSTSDMNQHIHKFKERLVMTKATRISPSTSDLRDIVL